MKRSDLGDLARFDRSDPPQTSVKYTPERICQKVKIFETFPKIKKLQKVTFAFLHTCTRYFAVLRGQNRKVASWALRSTLAFPNRPSRTFSHVSDVFAWSGSPKCTFGALGLFRAVPVAMRVSAADGRTDGELGSRDGLPYGRPREPLTAPPAAQGGSGQFISRVRVCKHSPPTPICDAYGWVWAGTWIWADVQ